MDLGYINERARSLALAYQAGMEHVDLAGVEIAEEVIEKSAQIDLKAEPEDTSEQGKKWQEILEKLNPEDFGKYKV